MKRVLVPAWLRLDRVKVNMTDGPGALQKFSESQLEATKSEVDVDVERQEHKVGLKGPAHLERYHPLPNYVGVPN